MGRKQKTISREATVSGQGLFTGVKTNITFKPAQENSGIVFVRVDLPGKPSVKAVVDNVITSEEVIRCTSIGSKEARIHTIEHLMSVLYGLGIDNLIIEIDNKEVPGLDGSGLEFLKTIKTTGLAEQSQESFCYAIKEPIGVEDNGSSIYVVPDEGFKISYTLNYDNPYLRSQFFSLTFDRDSFEKEIASCRTFCLEDESKKLIEMGLGKGATYKNTLVVGEKGVLDNEVRFKDEFARHKVLDFIGDLNLLGQEIKGHVFAVRSGHNLNVQLVRKIRQQIEKYRKKGIIIGYDYGDKKEIGISEIQKILPHRYPFLLIDKVIEIEKAKKAVGIKNVTINDGFFQGHFPTRPVMPGVLMVEAMAQTAGIVMLTNDTHHGKVAFFMAIDDVKFRKVVVPGDQLLMEVELLKERSKIAQFKGVARVNGDVVAEAEMTFSFTDASFLDA
ncbi:MAG: bifunctional UDP-3-O-[3-hydroxymyristoyl] N-acetylglucosamine deacetylase/3-hydroxyacyl-ACP dehydratase [Candidatus Omnitrophica bacterium]|nr:bifunctional UDP-3-O-[3-hydroxymyristoyl] N-acetylglucosamine deacetylase/3-hydroxyacyl-ACP dehydratase [Candidatus Omnitrophota bacterium]